MKMLSKIAAMAAMTIGLTISAGAQTRSGHAGSAETVNHGMPTSRLIGASICNSQGRSIGSVVDVMHAIEPTAILSMNDHAAVGTRFVTVPLSHMRLDAYPGNVAGATDRMVSHVSPDDLNWMQGGGG